MKTPAFYRTRLKIAGEQHASLDRRIAEMTEEGGDASELRVQRAAKAGEVRDLRAMVDKAEEHAKAQAKLWNEHAPRREAARDAARGLVVKAKEVDEALAALEATWRRFEASREACHRGALEIGHREDRLRNRLGRTVQWAMAKVSPVFYRDAEFPRVSASKWQTFEDSVRQALPKLPED